MFLKHLNIKLKFSSKRKTSFTLILQIAIGIMVTSCNKLVDVPPPTKVITENAVYTTDATAISVLTDLYAKMNYTPFQGGGGNISLFAGLAADEYQLNDGITDATYVGYYSNNLNAVAPEAGTEHWAVLYNYVFRVNAAIEGLTGSKKLSPAVKQQLLGEAKFMRAFFYFYLVNMFGDVPLALTTDPAVNRILARSSKDNVYEQIKKDLKEAEGLLSADFLAPSLLTTSSERVRPTKWAAAALLARVYLYTSDWTGAEAQSSLVINNSALFNLPASVNDVFLKNSQEAIWQLQPIDAGYNTQEAQMLIIPPGGPTPGYTDHPIRVSAQLLNSFEAGDKRSEIKNWMDSVEVSGTPYYFPFKYKQWLPDNNISGPDAVSYMTEYFMVLRLAEQYLIRAEARAHLGNTGGAQSDLNAIRNRAGLPNTTASDQTSLLTAILNERQHELFSEWGHRWFDLKRTGKIDEVMTVVTPIKSNGTNTWKSYQQLYPLPITDIQGDPNLKQNPGYN